jgi:hypothetical protein
MNLIVLGPVMPVGMPPVMLVLAPASRIEKYAQVSRSSMERKVNDGGAYAYAQPHRLFSPSTVVTSRASAPTYGIN